MATPFKKVNEIEALQPNSLQLISRVKMTDSGYFEKPNVVVDKLAALISDAAYKIYDIMIRKSYGFGKEFDCLSISQIMEFSGKCKTTVIKCCLELEKAGLVSVAGYGQSGTKVYAVAKLTDLTVEKVVQNLNRVSKKCTPCTKSVHQPVQILDTQKKLTKEKIDIYSPPVFSSSENQNQNQNQNTPPVGISADTHLTAEQVIALMLSKGWKKDTYAQHSSLVASVDMGVLSQDLDCALSKMQANGANNWDYFCQALQTTVTARIKNSQALPTPTNATNNKRPERKRRDTTAADIDLLVAEGVAADLAAQWVAFRASRNTGMLTQAFLDELKRQGKLLGLDMDLNAVVDVCLKKSWCGFEAAWIVKPQDKQQAPQGVAYKAFEPEKPVPAETKRERFENGKNRAKELLALTKRVTAGK